MKKKPDFSPLENIEVVPLIHQVHFSCRKSYEEIKFSEEDSIEEIKNYKVKQLNEKYNNGFYYNVNGKRVIVLRNPEKPFLAKFYIMISSPRPNDLLKLLIKFKDLKISSIEYTIDIFCLGPNQVRELYYLFKKYIILKRKKAKNRKGKKVIDIRFEEENTEYNFTYYIDTRFKMYERADDHLRLRKAWKFCDLDRLRIEFTADKYYRRKLGINSLFSFYRDLRMYDFFYYFVKERMFFMRFKESKRDLPMEHEDYIIGHNKENHNCIMYYKQTKNIQFRHFVNSSEFDQFKNDILEKAMKYEDNWKRRAKSWLTLKRKQIKHKWLKIESNQS